MQTKKLTRGLRFALTGMVALFCGGTPALAEDVPESCAVILRVNDSTLPCGAYQLSLIDRKTRYVLMEGREPDAETLKRLHEETLNLLIRNVLIGQSLRQAGMTSNPKEVQAALETFAQQKGYKNATELRDSMDSKARWRSLEEALTLQLLVKALKDEVISDVDVSETEVRAFYQKHLEDLYTQKAGFRAAHILLRARTPTEVKRRKTEIQNIYAQLRAGKDFAETARALSEDPSTKTAGGDIGWFEKGQMVEPFEKALLRLEKGNLSEPVLTRFGWHIIQRGETRPGKVFAFDEIKTRVISDVKREKQNRLFENWIQKKRERASISVHDSLRPFFEDNQ